MTEQIHKYPRTHHLEGSRLQPGDEDLSQTALDELRGRYVVIEEKLDGANCGISVVDGKLRLQSRGHYLVGGYRERHWDLLKQWAAVWTAPLERLLDGGLVLYGEWLYAKHTIAYDALPHYLMEFDVRSPDGAFWSTARRRALLDGSPVRSVPVIWEGVLDDPAELPELVRPSLYKTPRWRDALEAAAVAAGVDPARVAAETDPSDLAEGLYVKVEEDGVVTERYKWIRASFLTAVLDSGGHWLDRPIVPNGLAEGVDLFA